jgi:hypothetical protein
MGVVPLSRVALLVVAAVCWGALGACSVSTEEQPVPGTAAVTLLPCRDPVGSLATPGPDVQVIGGAIALGTSTTSPQALQTSDSGLDDAALRLFAKTGLLVRTGAQAELVVPSSWSGRAAFAWGNAAVVPTERLAAGPCAEVGPWLAYPGGYYVRDPACIPVVVRVGGEETQIHVGVGAPCPGQQAPAAPSET